MTQAISFQNYQGLTELTDEIQFIPNKYGKLTQMGLFKTRSTAQTSLTIDRVDGVLTVLEAGQRGSRKNYGTNEKVRTFSYPIPFFDAQDNVLPSDVQGRRRPGSSGQQDGVDMAVARKLTNLRKAHAMTKEYMLIMALKGVTTTPDGAVYADMAADFGGIGSVDPLPATTGDADAWIRDLVRYVEDNAFADTDVGGIHVLCGTEWFEQLIQNDGLREAYLYYQSNQEPNRENVSRGFRHMGVFFEEYRPKFKGMDGNVLTPLASDEAIAFPTNVEDMFEIWYAPADHINYVGTAGEEVYAWSVMRPDGSGIDIDSQSAMLPICRRPKAVVVCTKA